MMDEPVEVEWLAVWGEYVRKGSGAEVGTPRTTRVVPFVAAGRTSVPDESMPYACTKSSGNTHEDPYHAPAR
jgi:hypothetical protein